MAKMLLFLLPMLGALLIGAGISTQSSINAVLARYLGSPVWVSFVSLLSATVLLALALLSLNVPLFNWQRAAQAPWWAWLGGALGALALTFTVVLVPKLGIGMFVLLVLSGQIIMALLIDHFALFGMVQRPIDGIRLLGVICLIVGVVLVQFGGRMGK